MFFPFWAFMSKGQLPNKLGALLLIVGLLLFCLAYVFGLGAALGASTWLLVVGCVILGIVLVIMGFVLTHSGH